MNRRGLKPKKHLSKKDRLKPEWDSRFCVEKIPEYNKVKEQVSFLKLYRTNLTPSDQKAFKPQNEDDPDINLNIDPEIASLWNELGVTQDFRHKFIQKLNYFNDSFHYHFYEREKKSLKQISYYLIRINNELNSRDKSLACLKDVSENLIKETNSKVISEVKTALINIKINMSNIVSSLKKLNKKTQFSILKGKYYLEKVKYGYILDPLFVIKLNSDLQFIREGPIGKLFNLRRDFDPLLIDLDDKNDNSKIDKKILIDNSYTLFIEMIYNNLISNKSLCPRLSSSTVQLKVLTKTASRIRMSVTPFSNNPNTLNYSVRNNNSKKERKDDLNKPHHNDTRNRTKEDLKAMTNDKDTIYCKTKELNDKHVLSPKNDNSDLNVPEVRDDYIVNDKDSKDLSKITDSKAISKSLIKKQPLMTFFTRKIYEFIPIYNQYNKSIPNKQKTIFNIENDITKYFSEGINPLLVTHYNKEKLTSLCIIMTDPYSPNSLFIRHVSSSLESELQYIITHILSFIQSNIPFKEISINLHYNNNDKNNNDSNKGIELEDEISLMFKQLNFQWMNMENSEERKLFQTLKCKNNNEITQNNNNNTTLEIKSGVIAWIKTLSITQDDNSNTNNDSNADKLFKVNTQKVNLLNKQMIFSLINKSSKTEGIKEALRYLEVFEGIEEEAIKFLLAKGFNKEDFMPFALESKQQTFLSCFKLLPLFKTISTKKINSYIYNRITANNNLLIDKKTNQSLYQFQQNDYFIIIGEMTSELSKHLISHDNIYEAFSSFYSKIECVKRDNKSSVVWVPAFSICDKSSSLHNDDSKIALTSFSITNFSYCQYYFNTITHEQNDDDILISKSFVFAVINMNNKTSITNQIIFCSIVEQSDWKCGD